MAQLILHFGKNSKSLLPELNRWLFHAEVTICFDSTARITRVLKWQIVEISNASENSSEYCCDRGNYCSVNKLVIVYKCKFLGVGCG